MDLIKAILYDLDGVLVDATEWHYESLNEALKEISGFEISRQEHVSTFNGLPTMRKLDILFQQKRILKNDFDSIWSLKQEKTNEIIKNSIILCWITNVLHIKNGKPNAIKPSDNGRNSNLKIPDTLSLYTFRLRNKAIGAIKI